MTPLLNGQPCTQARVSVPARGLWTASVRLATDVPIAGPASLVIGDLVLVGTVLFTRALAGAVTARIVAGTGGWLRDVGQSSERNDAGVFLSTVVAKIAAEAGEAIDLAFVDRVVGSSYMRLAGPASDALTRSIGAPDWYVGFDGVARLGARLPTACVGDVMDRDVGPMCALVAAESLASVLPGALHPTLGQIGDVVHEIMPARTRSLVALEAA